MKKSVRILSFVVLFVLSFSFFVFYTFPYEVLKEVLASEISQATGMQIRLGELRPKLPLGVKARNIQIKSESGQEFRIDRASISLSVFTLIIGRLGVGLELEQKAGKYIYIFARVGVLDLIQGNPPMPSRVEVQSTRFGLGDLINFSLASLADNPTTNPLLSPVLKQIGFEGDLDADISLSLDADDLSQSSGIVFLDFKSAELFFDKALTIPDQKFSKALMRGNIAGGQFTIDGNSGFVSDGIHLDFNGKVALRSRMDQSIMDLSISIKLFESLLEQFSFIVDAMTGGSRGGQLTLKIGGTLGQPSFNTI